MERPGRGMMGNFHCHPDVVSFLAPSHSTGSRSCWILPSDTDERLLWLMKLMTHKDWVSWIVGKKKFKEFSKSSNSSSERHGVILHYLLVFVLCLYSSTAVCLKHLRLKTRWVWNCRKKCLIWEVYHLILGIYVLQDYANPANYTNKHGTRSKTVWNCNNSLVSS